MFPGKFISSGFKEPGIIEMLSILEDIFDKKTLHSFYKLQIFSESSRISEPTWP